MVSIQKHYIANSYVINLKRALRQTENFTAGTHTVMCNCVIKHTVYLDRKEKHVKKRDKWEVEIIVAYLLF